MTSLVYAQACPVTGNEGDLIELNPEAFDPDPEIGPAGELLWEFGTPFDADGRWQTLKGMRGIFPFYVSVSDGELKDTVHSCVELFPNNQDPVLEPLEEFTIVRGETAQISATCNDPDGDAVEISFRFRGRDVAYIQYEPPGTYNLDVTCTDGFGGIDSERTLIHIVMPDTYDDVEVKHTPWIPPEEQEVVYEAPQEIELILPDECPPQTEYHPIEDVDLETILPEDIEVKRQTPEVVEVIGYCRPEIIEVISEPPQPYNVEIVHPQPYDVDVIYPVKECGTCPDCPPCPAPEEPEKEPEEELGCGGDNSRKGQINRVLNRCCR